MAKSSAKATIDSYQRQCRACGKWATVKADVMTGSSCPYCSSIYGSVAMGLDVPRFKGARAKLPKPAAGQVEATKVRRPRIGEFR